MIQNRDLNLNNRAQSVEGDSGRIHHHHQLFLFRRVILLLHHYQKLLLVLHHLAALLVLAQIGQVCQATRRVQAILEVQGAQGGLLVRVLL